jgi:hypothetical protein
MEWTTKQPNDWRRIPGMREHSTAFCSTTPRGEYVVHHVSGNFVVFLESLPLTAFPISSAVDAISWAKEYDGKLGNLNVNTP